MKRIGFWMLCLIGFLGLLVLIVRLLYPPHPHSWYQLSRDMSHSEVLAILDASNLELIARNFDRPGLAEEVWVKKYWCGRWVVRCTYYKENLSLFSANVSYESYVFPFTRMRNYN